MTTYERAVGIYGKDMQLNVAIEELSELIKEICKNKRGADNIDNITEELADCYIMMAQLEIIFDIKPISLYSWIDEKLARLEESLAERREG